MNNRNDEMAAWLNEPRTVEPLRKKIMLEDLFLDRITDKEILVDDDLAEQVLSIGFYRDDDLAELKSLDQCAFERYTNSRFVKNKSFSKNALAQHQAEQIPTKKPRAKNDTPDYLKDELKRIYNAVVNKKPVGVIAEIERLCRIRSSGWELDVNTSAAVFSCDCPSCPKGIYTKSITLSSRNISRVCRDFR